jgi:dTMP kinase
MSRMRSEEIGKRAGEVQQARGPARSPLFITFEGIEGSGKTTLSKGLTGSLLAQGIAAVWTREPGHEWDTPEQAKLGQAIREILLHTPNLNIHTELFLFLADRSYHVQNFIRPHLSSGAWVLCDRYTDSTLAYQGYGRGLDIEKLREWNDTATGGLKPDITFLIDLPVEVALQRAAETTRFEQESFPFHEHIRQGFLAEAAREPQRFAVLDGTQSPLILQQQAAAICASYEKAGRMRGRS